MEANEIAGLGIGLAAVGVTAHLVGKMISVTKEKTKNTGLHIWL